jgi:antitoxin CptB
MPALMTLPDLKNIARLRYRSWHRGTRELDMLLGPFADAYLHTLTPDSLRQYAALLDHSEPDLYKWLTGIDPFPDALKSDFTAFLTARIRERNGLGAQ